MTTIIFCVIILLLFVIDSHTVISGATYGLMLWYNNVLPILLPFMLISGILVRNVNHMNSNSADSSRRSMGIIITFFLGVLCGYPLGAKTASDFVQSDTYSTRIGNILLPLCNNSSPMFISGYIVHNILHDSISLPATLLLIYTPYIIFMCISILFCRLTSQISTQHNNNNFSDNTILSNIHNASASSSRRDNADDSDPMLTAIHQITFVGIYIMICSIIIEFAYRLPVICEPYFTYIAGVTEITRGTYQIGKAVFLSENIKTALVLAVTSFGGMSSILQTNKVISSSGLSIIRYIFVKLLCGVATFCLTLLLI